MGTVSLAVLMGRFVRGGLIGLDVGISEARVMLQPQGSIVASRTNRHVSTVCTENKLIGDISE